MKKGFKGKKPKCRYGRNMQKDSETYSRYAEALSDNLTVNEEIQEAGDIGDTPDPILVPTAAVLPLILPASGRNRNRPDDNWRINRKVVSLEKKLKKATDSKVAENNASALKLTKEKRKRVSAENRAESEKVKRLQAKELLNTGEKFRLTAEKKVS